MVGVVFRLEITVITMLIAHSFVGIGIGKVLIENSFRGFFVIGNCVPQLLLPKHGKKGRGISN